MSIKLSKTKDIITRNVQNYQNAQIAYSKYFQGSPCFITYYKIDPKDSTQDNDLEAVHSFIGHNSPVKYTRIFDVAAYGPDTLDIQNQYTERGLESISSGELFFLPDTITPQPGDFFTFDIDGMTDHLFRVEDVQFDRATQHKYYRIQYSLYKDNIDMILGNISDDDKQFIYSNIGDSDATVISSKDALTAEKTEALYDKLNKRFTELFYDSDMDTFTCRVREFDGRFVNYWCPYLQQFIYENQLCENYSNEIMTEYYINGINSLDFPSIFSDDSYYMSLFKCLAQNDELEDHHSIVSISGIDLKKYIGLPFAFSPLEYRMLDLYNGNPAIYVSSKPIIEFEKCGVYSDLLQDSSGTYKISKQFTENTAPVFSNGEKNLTINESTNSLWDIVKSYLSEDSSFKITDDVNELINTTVYKRTIENYFLIPCILYILKQKISQLYQN